MDSTIDFDLIKKANSFMQEEGLEEFEYRVPNLEVKLKKMVTSFASDPVAQTTIPVAAAPVVETKAAPVPAVPATPVATSHANIKSVKSPFVGTFYRSPSPNDPSFVEEGSVVGVGDTLCIVEAMKLMNEIECDWKGRVVKIYLEDTSPVEYGEKLFDIELL